MQQFVQFQENPQIEIREILGGQAFPTGISSPHNQILQLSIDNSDILLLWNLSPSHTHLCLTLNSNISMKLASDINEIGNILFSKCQNLRHLRLILRFPLLAEDSYFGECINNLSNLKSMDIISQSYWKDDDYPNWTSKLKLKPQVLKLTTYAKVIQQLYTQAIKPEILSKMQKTIPERQYQTFIDDESCTILREFYKIESWRCLHLSYRNKNEWNICKYLNGISFEYLKKLDLSNNVIQTVDPLARLKASQLLDINIGHNRITNIRPLIKLKSIKLEFLELNDNFIEEGQDLPFSNFRILQYNMISLYEGSQFIGTEFLAKLRARYHEKYRLNLNINERSMQTPIAEMLKSKLKSLYPLLAQQRYKMEQERRFQMLQERMNKMKRTPMQ